MRLPPDALEQEERHQERQAKRDTHKERLSLRWEQPLFMCGQSASILCLAFRYACFAPLFLEGSSTEEQFVLTYEELDLSDLHTHQRADDHGIRCRCS